MIDMLQAKLTELADEARPVDLLDRVHKGARRISNRNRAIVSLVVVAALLTGVWLMNRPAKLPDGTNPVLPDYQTLQEEFLNSAVDLPAFPGDEPQALCPAGRYDLGGGRAPAPGWHGELYLNFAGFGPVWGDLDGVPGDEMAMLAECQSMAEPTKHHTLFQVLVVKPLADNHFRILGYAVNSPDHANLAFEEHSVRVEDRQVKVFAVGPFPIGPVVFKAKQDRGFAYQNGKFVQVSGPTSFPEPEHDIHRIDFRTVTMQMDYLVGSTDIYGVVRFNDGKGRELDRVSDNPAGVAHLSICEYSQVSNPVFVKTPTTDGTVIMMTVQCGDGNLNEVAAFVDPLTIGSIPSATGVVVSGTQGVTHIVGVSSTGEVTVETATGAQVWSFHYNGKEWKRDN